MASAGYWALVLTLLVSLYCVVASLLGAQRRSAALLRGARIGAYVSAATATASSVVLLLLMLSGDLSVRYVYDHVNGHLPPAYRLSAFWAGQAGSMLLWLWMVAVLQVVLTHFGHVWDEPSGPYVLAVMAFTQGFLALVLVLLSNPFARLPSMPLEGRGLNPLLQNPWMVMHPPVVFLAYAAYTVPFALSIGGLAVGCLDRRWLDVVRRWALLAWLLLSAGILMGAYWAYLELGWGGYWGWDPVENSSLVPWLTGTALLHSLMMGRRREAFRAWNLWLASWTFLLCMFATFVTRSGVIQSVHAFGRSPIGYYFVGYIALCLVTLAALMSVRRPSLGEPYEFRVLLSRETTLLVTVLLLVGAALVVLVGTVFPALVELLQGRQAALDVSFYERTVGPLVLAVISVLAVCPWLAWGGRSTARLRRVLLPSALVALTATVGLFALGVRQVVALLAFAVCAFVTVSLVMVFYRGTVDRRARTGEGLGPAFYRSIAANRRRYGAHVVHLGIVLMAIGVTGSSLYQDEVQFALAPGESADAHGYTIEYRGLVPEGLPDRHRFVAVVDVRRGDRLLNTLRPEKGFHWNVEQWVTEVAIHTTAKEDLYVILAGFENDGLASFRVLLNPLVLWLWIGGIVLLLGGAVAWWPAAAERSPVERQDR